MTQLLITSDVTGWQQNNRREEFHKNWQILPFHHYFKHAQFFLAHALLAPSCKVLNVISNNKKTTNSFNDRRLARIIHCAGSATYQIFFRLPIPNPIPNPNPITDPNPNRNPKNKRKQNDTWIKFIIEYG